MKEKFELTPRPTDIVGHCKVEYKDPITDKVLEKIEGDNHVFIDQFYVSNLKSLLNCNLILTNGTSTLDTSMPVIPGLPIGYGEVSSGGDGIFRGAYRASDSYVYKIDDEKIENNYVYDFVGAQIPDTIRYVGLHVKQKTFPTFFLRENNDQYYNNAKIVSIDDNCSYYLRVTTTSNSSYNSPTTQLNNTSLTSLKIRKLNFGTGNGYSWEDKEVLNLIESDIDLTSSYSYNNTTVTPTNSYQWYTLGYDPTNEYFVIHGIVKRYDNNGSHGSATKIYSWFINKNCTEVLNKYETELIRESRNGFSSDTFRIYYQNSSQPSSPMTCAYGFVKDNNFYYFTTYNSSLTNTSEFYLVKKNLETNIEEEQQFILSSNYYKHSAPNLCIYKNFIWLPNYYSSNNTSTSLSISANQIKVTPIINTTNSSIYSYITDIYGYIGESSTEYNGNNGKDQLIRKGFGSSYPNTWFSIRAEGSRYSDITTTLCLPFALTAYQLPQDAPTRPEGAAVTVTYNLQIFY